MRDLLLAHDGQATLVVDEPDLIKPWLELDLMSWWIEFGIRQLEDYLLVHAAFQQEFPETEE